jgi:hypothetical protein
MSAEQQSSKVGLTRRGEVAKAIIHFYRDPYNVAKIAARVPEIKPGTVAASLSALHKVGSIDRIEMEGTKGYWYKTSQQVLQAVDPIKRLIADIESHSAQRRENFRKHLERHVPANLRKLPGPKLVAYVDFYERSISVKKLAILTKQELGSAARFCEALVAAQLLDWNGNRVRRTRIWNLDAAQQVVATVATQLKQPQEAPPVLEHKEPERHLKAVVVEERRPRTAERAPDNVLQEMKELLGQYSLVEIIEDYRNLRGRVRDLEAQLQRYQILENALKAAGMVVPGMVSLTP